MLARECVTKLVMPDIPRYKAPSFATSSQPSTAIAKARSYHFMNSMSLTSKVTIGGEPQDVAAESVVTGVKPLVSIILPAYNEAAIIEQNLARVYRHMSGMEDDYRGEMVIVND